MPVFFKPVFDFFPFFCSFPSQTVEEPIFYALKKAERRYDPAPRLIGG